MATASSSPALSVPAEIQRTGKLRVGLSVASGVIASRDPATGEWRGVAVAVSRELAKRMGVSVEFMGYATGGAVREDSKSWDINFISSGAAGPAPNSPLDFSAPVFQIDQVYLIRAGSSIRSIADLDKPGVRVAVNAGNAVSIAALLASLKQATLIRMDAAQAAAPHELLNQGVADVLAGDKNAILLNVMQLPGSHVLDEPYGVRAQLLGVNKGHDELLAYCRAFLEQAKASGLVKEAIERTAVLGLDVSPPAAR